MIGRRLAITGHVQGVFYRAWTVRQAEELGLDGWVRNRRDGSVEILVRGDAGKVAELIERCRRGPPKARVARIKVAEAEEKVASGFEKRPTV